MPAASGDQADPPLSVLSPVKLNLFLHVIGRRRDGYHLLQTLFQFLDYGDRMTFEHRPDTRLCRLDRHPYPLPEQDLCIKAAERLRSAAGLPQAGATITLEKVIPPGSGLGAGSANAATTLLALNQLWRIHYSANQLMEIGKTLGADVPVFIYGRTAWAEGIGDELRSFDVTPSWYCVIIPDADVDTRRIFSSDQLRRDHERVTDEDFIRGATGNDLESVTTMLYPEVGEALVLLNRFGAARMSGTGSAVFTIVKNKDTAAEILRTVPDHWTAFAAPSSEMNPTYRDLHCIPDD